MKEIVVKGIFKSSKNGYGFVISDCEPDIFIPESQINGAMHDDEVVAQITRIKNDGKNEGQITKVLKRNTKKLIGTVDMCKRFAFVIPDDQHYCRDIFINKKHLQGASDKDKVEVTITSYGNNTDNPEGYISEVIGNIKKPGTAVYCIVKSYDIHSGFTTSVIDEALRVCDKSLIKNRVNSRKDLRNILTITIDGEDARDLDDAVSVERIYDGYRLGVHIADVSEYVKEYSAIDLEAYQRGTSVYLPDRVIPMLPAELSNDICSLNAGEDRLTLSCIMDINKKGQIINSEICESVINVNRRCSYTEVQSYFDGNDSFDSDIEEMLDEARILADVLHKKRISAGLVDFDFPEAKIILDKRGRAVRIDPYVRTEATMLIENFMLIANETVAEYYHWMDIPFLYRTHEAPDEDRIEKLALSLSKMGYYIKGTDVHPKELQKLLDKVADTPDEAFVSRIILRSMKQARYTVEAVGHFGLAVKYYTHFTSPIRRYPDLQIHRIIKEVIHGALDDLRISHYQKILPEVAIVCSNRERIADETERECEKLMKAQYMQRHIGEEYTGIISGVANWGMYVMLQNTVEGLVSIYSFYDDNYYYDEENIQLIGEQSKNTFTIGQKVRIRVKGADITTRNIDFELTDGSYHE